MYVCLLEMFASQRFACNLARPWFHASFRRVACCLFCVNPMNQTYTTKSSFCMRFTVPLLVQLPCSTSGCPKASRTSKGLKKKHQGLGLSEKQTLEHLSDQRPHNSRSFCVKSSGAGLSAKTMIQNKMSLGSQGSKTHACNVLLSWGSCRFAL